MTKATASEPKVELPQRQYDAMQSQMLELKQSNEALKQQLDWFKRQVFGTKSEKRAVANGEQAALFQGVPPAQTDDGPAPITVPAHQRRKHRTGDEVNDTGIRFGADVPVREIVLTCPELSGPDADQYEVIDHKVSLRLARQPGSHVVLKYLRPVVRRKADGALQTVPAPLGVLDHAQVDVSFLAGMLVDKFQYHLPLYRQHQRLADEGIVLSRSTIDEWVRRAIDLLGPIGRAVFEQIRAGAHLKIDETPIRAGRTSRACVIARAPIQTTVSAVSAPACRGDGMVASAVKARMRVMKAAAVSIPFSVDSRKARRKALMRPASTARMSQRRLKPAAASTALSASPVAPFNQQRAIR